MDQRLNQPRFGLGEPFSIGGIDSYIAEGGGAVVLYIDVGGGKKLN